MKSLVITFKSVLIAIIFSTAFSGHSQTTQLRADFCGATLSTLGENVFANAVNGAQTYRFRIINQSTFITTIFDSPNRWFNLVNAGVTPLNNQTYQVDIALNMGSGFGSFGTVCSINTPNITNATTQIRADFCGITLTSLNTNIFADNVPGATMYRFRLVNQTTSIVTIFDSPNRWFNLVGAGALPQNNQVFDVQVSVDLGLGFGAFGSACNIFTPMVPDPMSKIRNDFCGIYLNTVGTNIFADNVTGAQGYRFRITNVVTNVTVIHDRPNRWFNLITAGVNPQPTQEYLIDVAVNMGSGFGPFGIPCTVFTPHVSPTQIQASDCGRTIDFLFYEYFHAIPVPQAESYQFRIKNGNFVSTTNDTTEALTRFSNFAEYAYGTSYDVDVRVKINGVWGPYGPSCVLSTIDVPYTQVQTNQFGGGQYCGATLVSITQRIYAYRIPLVTAYKFRVTRDTYIDSIQTIERDFKLSDLPNFSSNLVFDVAYNVEVAIEFNGTFTEYGVICQVFTPSPITQLRADFCGVTLTSIGQNIFAIARPGATQYRFEINNGNTTTIFTTNNRWFNLVNAGVAAPNTVYTVRVAIGVNGFFYDYGPGCTVQSPPGVMMPDAPGVTDAEANDSNNLVQNHEISSPIFGTPEIFTSFASIYPNPVNDSFKLNFSSIAPDQKVRVTIFDASGAQLCSITEEVALIQNMKFGSDFAQGVYFVTVESHQLSQTLRIIKTN